jgi:hypothetical protein
MPADQVQAALADAAPTTPQRAASLPPAAADIQAQLDAAKDDHERISIVSEHLPELVRLIVESKGQHGEILEALAKARLERAEGRNEVAEVATQARELSKATLTILANQQTVTEALKRITHRQEQDHTEVCQRFEGIEHQLGIAARASKAQAQRDSQQDLAAAKAAETAKAADEVASKAVEVAKAAAATTTALQASHQQQAATIEQHETTLQWVVRRVGWFGLLAFFGSALVQLLWKIFVR